ncbi:hypothetical protein H5410_030487 [Solanum commersonii]|uniref:Uncharacterized protein n=1 Tax=Solanum commersonii TaxID=4109 RepID=A0A9J5YGB1_SOLCO|nr:hypothetical protein H5410_030487 [Solanum commersonii]
MLSPIGLPLFSNRLLIRLTEDEKCLSKACNGAECKENQFDKWLITMKCKEFTYCLCNFIWPHRSHTFMFVQLRELFKSSILIEIEI